MKRISLWLAKGQQLHDVNHNSKRVRIALLSNSGLLDKRQATAKGDVHAKQGILYLTVSAWLRVSEEDLISYILGVNSALFDFFFVFFFLSPL